MVVHPLSKKKNLVGFPAIYDFVYDDVKKIAKFNVKKLVEAWKSISADEKNKLLTVNGKSVYPYIKQHLDFLFSRQFLYVFLVYYLAMKNAVARNNIRAIYLTASIGLFEKCGLLLGKLLKLPVFIAQHGAWINFAKVEEEMLDGVTFFVFGEKYKKLLVDEMGIAESKIAVTGSAMVDEVKHVVKSKELNKVLVLTQPFVEDKAWNEEQRKIFFDALKDVIRRLKNVEFVIKIHPREMKEVYEKDFSNVKITDKELYKEIKEADLVIGVNSAALMEALLLNRGVIVLDLFEQAASESHVVSGLSLRVGSTSEFFERLESYLKFYRSSKFDLMRLEYIKNYFYKVDGKASERIVKVIMEKLK